MAAYLEDIYTALRTRIGAVWTDVLLTGIWEAEHQNMIPWADITPPCAAIVIGDLAATPDYGVANNAYMGQVEIYYVAAVTGESAGIRAKLEALRDDLYTNELLTGQVIDVTDLDWSRDLEANAVFDDKDYTHRVGQLTVTVVMGETNV